MENVKLYLRPRSKQSVYSRRRLLALFALLLASGLLIVLLSGWPAAYADGAASAPPSIARSSASPPIQVPRANTTGVYIGCQELEPASELPQSSR